MNVANSQLSGCCLKEGFKSRWLLEKLIGEFKNRYRSEPLDSSAYCGQNRRRARQSAEEKGAVPRKQDAIAGILVNGGNCADAALAAGQQYSVGVRPSHRSEHAGRGIHCSWGLGIRLLFLSLCCPAFPSPSPPGRWFAYILVSPSRAASSQFPTWDFVSAYRNKQDSSEIAGWGGYEDVG